ncbi:MAG TPA: type II and III secretion system protein family protein [Brevundimonas sp.]|nr:type II and III secretion system protein family protein [Brevundimonas sp.]
MKRLLVCCLTGLALSVAAPLTAPTHAHAQSRAAVPMGAGSQLINLPRGSSMAIDLPADARDVIVPNPVVAEAMLHSPRRITVIGLAGGETDAVFLDAAGRTILALRVRVDAGTSALQDTLSRVAPGANVHAEAVNDSIILTGTASSPAEADRAVQIARAFVTGPEKVMNMISVAGSDQVTLRVRVVEVQRSAIKQLGFDTQAIVGRLGDTRFLLGNTATFGVNGGMLGGITGGVSRDTTLNGTQPGSEDLNKGSATIKAFERVGLVRTLAEPNLTSVNGEAASFLAGGEFPVPAGRDQNGQITVAYKPFGVGLSFRPVVLSEGRISLQVKVEVSELTPQGGLTIGAGTPSAVSLPGLSVRRSENTVELPSGGSMMIAGLLQETTRQTVDSLPGATNLPVLGQLFRSRDYLMGETELVVIVEAYVVNPTAPGRMQTPADGLRIASDAQTLFFGQLNQAYGSPAPSARAGWQGPVGYVIE